MCYLLYERGAMKRVTMNLTDQDIRNTESLTARLNSRNKAATVSSALAITEGLAKKLAEGGELIIRKRDGTLETVLITGLNGASG